MVIVDRISTKKRQYDAENGSVLGIDVGWSKTKPTTGLCLLEWTAHQISWNFYDATVNDREVKLDELVGEKKLLAVGLDGPLVPGLRCVKAYRAADALLSRGQFQHRGKPGPTNGGFGYRLHEEATKLAELVLRTQDVAVAFYPYNVYDKAVVEAFPNAFLAVLHSDKGFPPRPQRRRRWTDTLFCQVDKKLEQLLLILLPGRKLARHLAEIHGHEKRASFVCSLTALCAVAGRCVAVGSQKAGYIVLPPLEFWGREESGGGKWAANTLSENYIKVQCQPEFSDTKLYRGNKLWVHP